MGPLRVGPGPAVCCPVTGGGGPGRWWAAPLGAPGGTGPGPQKGSPRKALGQRLVLLVTVKCREPVGVPGQAHDEGRGQGLHRKPRVRWVAGLTLGPKTLVSLDEGSQGSQF